MRIKFAKGKQREFIDEVMKSIGCPSLKELVNRGVGVSYSSLKNYYSERRLLSRELFNELCGIAGFDSGSFSFEEISDNWGNVLGGKKSRKAVRENFK